MKHLTTTVAALAILAAAAAARADDNNNNDPNGHDQQRGQTIRPTTRTGPERTAAQAGNGGQTNGGQDHRQSRTTSARPPAAKPAGGQTNGGQTNGGQTNSATELTGQNTGGQSRSNHFTTTSHFRDMAAKRPQQWPNRRRQSEQRRGRDLAVAGTGTYNRLSWQQPPVLQGDCPGGFNPGFGHSPRIPRRRPRPVSGSAPQRLAPASSTRSGGSTYRAMRVHRAGTSAPGGLATSCHSAGSRRRITSIGTTSACRRRRSAANGSAKATMRCLSMFGPARCSRSTRPSSGRARHPPREVPTLALTGWRKTYR